MIDEFNQGCIEKLDEGKTWHLKGRKSVKVDGKTKVIEKEELLEYYKKRIKSGPLRIDEDEVEMDVCDEENTHEQAANIDDEKEEMMTG